MEARVRFGGYRGPNRYHFEMSGGAPCLDFANTVDNRPTEPRELLGDYRDLVSWGVQAGVLTKSDAGSLERRARRERDAAEAALLGARSIREVIFRIFSAVARQRKPATTDLHALSRAVRQASAGCELRPVGSAVTWSWTSEAATSLDLVTWRAVRSAADLLTSADAARVRECDGAGCAWLFLDTTRNHSRRWCDMTVCGNRAKARRFRARVNPEAG